MGLKKKQFTVIRAAKMQVKKGAVAGIFRGTAGGALSLRLAIVDGEQQRIALTIHKTFSDSVNSHIASGLCFQPASFTPLRLPLHAPAPNFGSTTPHF